MQIILCDDEKSIQSLLKQKITHFLAKKNIPCEILCCNSGEEVLSLARQGASMDLLFLDIQMPGRNGMEIARQLRRQYRDILIIFVTALSEYVYEAFDVNAFHYLVKPFSDEKLRKVLGSALEQYEMQTADAQMKSIKPDEQTQPRAIVVKRGGISTKVYFSDIIYAEVFNRKVMLHTIHGDIEYYGKLTDLSEQAGADFYRTHNLAGAGHGSFIEKAVCWLCAAVYAVYQSAKKYRAQKTAMIRGKNGKSGILL